MNAFSQMLLDEYKKFGIKSLDEIIFSSSIQEKFGIF